MHSCLSRFGMSARLSIAASVLIIAVAAPAAAQTMATSYSGEASGVIALVENPLGGDPLVDETLVQAGPLDPEGGFDEDELFEASIEGLLTADVISAVTEGAGQRARSSAEILGLDLSVATLVDATSSTLRSTAIARCGHDGAVVSGDSVVEDLSINGTDIDVTGEPNQEVELGPVTVIINEQSSFVEQDGSFGEITVNALHIIVDDPTTGETLVDVILAQSHADVTCLPDSSTDGAIEAIQSSTGTPANPVPLMLVLLGGVAVSMLLVRPLIRR